MNEKKEEKKKRRSKMCFCGRKGYGRLQKLFEQFSLLESLPFHASNSTQPVIMSHFSNRDDFFQTSFVVI